MRSPKLLAAALVLSAVGLGFIAQSENGPTGPRTVAYADAVGVPTVCTGSTKGVTLGMRRTLAQCEVLLQEDTTYAGAAVGKYTKVPITQGQYDALVSFVFNCGPTAYKNSTLLRKLNAGNCTGAAQEFLRWDMAKGKRLRGLTARRKAESTLFIKDCND